MSGQIVGLLLAAGRGRRFDPSGSRSKLLQSLPTACGQTVLATAAGNLAAALPICVVLRYDVAELITQVAGYAWVQCEAADDGMAASLVYGLQQTADAAGWVIALADMPYVQTSTIHALASALRLGADIAVPTHLGRRGNPVGFGRKYLPQLLALRGDHGARSLLQSLPVVEVAVDDPGIHQDIDTVADIRHSST
ncbi:nucleotidyltransferase family protein [Collimonas sp.]|jgi:molybdenum cofactor cytidylyltransferase|uniref:nucleotidyltransferase family protein n=1 Tax=Collimonas sp. TaxID=1963772 RepID=UPI002BB33C3A|nr:nucleotidyltransferase family protein [Collimonas sp.]HWW04096.1 nucleotidyltransferase family protein [Collimonas sp.]